MLLMIDNYDSFTYNVVQYLAELGADVQVYRNDEITIEQIEELNPERLVISPGPCTPNEAGISMAAIEHVAGKPPELVREGATIPVVGTFKQELGLDTMLIGFGRHDDRIHSPNEKFDLGHFYLGCETHAALLAELAKVGK